MALKKFISKLTSGLFEVKENKQIKKDPLEDENTYELKEIQRKIVDIVDTDCEDIIIDLQGYENCKILENYVSFMDTINYLSKEVKSRKKIDFCISLFPEDTEKEAIHSNVVINVKYKSRYNSK
jgi:hypothetical protein